MTEITGSQFGSRLYDLDLVIVIKEERRLHLYVMGMGAIEAPLKINLC